MNDESSETKPQAVNGDKRAWGRRVRAAAVWFVALELSFYFCILKHIDLKWFELHGEYLTAGLFFVVSGLTATDIFRRQK